jgi:hypothetical protein
MLFHHDDRQRRQEAVLESLRGRGERTGAAEFVGPDLGHELDGYAGTPVSAPSKGDV